MEERMTKQELLRKKLGSKFFTVTFTKKDGSVRKLNGRLGVTKHLRGGEKTYSDVSINAITVFDLVAKGYRTVKLDNVLSLNCGQDLTHLVREVIQENWDADHADIFFQYTVLKDHIFG